jgi:predicted ester cyclase
LRELFDGPNLAARFRHRDGCRRSRRRRTLEDREFQEGRMSTTSRTAGRKAAPKHRPGTNGRTTAASRPQKHKTALRDAVAALNAGDAEKYLALFRPDAELHGFPAGIEDVDALCRFHAATADTFPDASVTLDDAVAESDRVATRFTWRATQGPGLSLVAQGGAIVRFAEGQIAECWNLPADVHAVTS